MILIKLWSTSCIPEFFCWGIWGLFAICIVLFVKNGVLFANFAAYLPVR